MMHLHDPARGFRATIYEALGHAPDAIEPGRLMRFSTSGRRCDKSGWCKLFADGRAGIFGCWRTGLTQIWAAGGSQQLTPSEQRAMQAQIRAAQREREAELHHTHQQAADEALRRWKAASLAPADHPYLVAKGIGPHGARIEGNRLLIAMHDAAGTIRSLQSIAPDGSKRFLPGGQVRGQFFMIGRPSGTVLIAEGFATGASIHEAAGIAVAVAFNCGNLQPVAAALRRRFPCADLVICADDDWRTEGNPGLTAAKAAALAVGADVVQPFFPVKRPDKATDFNDLHQFCGLAAVRQCLGESEERP